MTRSVIDESLLDIAWSLWAELGVPGWRRNHSTCAIDPEALIVFTGGLLELDSRLRDEAAGWCVGHSRLISKIRLRNIARAQSGDVAAQFYAFARALNRTAKLNWPVEPAEASPKTMSVKSMSVSPRRRPASEDFAGRPSAIGLRLRSIFGVGARAEIMRMYLAYDDVALSAPEIAVQVFYGRRNVADALDALQFAGVFGSVRDRNATRYALRSRPAIQQLAGEVPHSYPFWPEILGLLLDLRAVLASPKRSSLLRAIEAQKFLEGHAFSLARNGLPGIAPSRVGDDAWAFLEGWAVGMVRELAENPEHFLKTPKLHPTYVRVTEAPNVRIAESSR